MRLLKVVALVLALCTAAQAEQTFVLQCNMDELKCSMPDTTYRFVGSKAPGQLFLPDEPIDLKFAFKKGDDQGKVDFALEIQEIGTRTPGKVNKGMEGFTDTGGHAPVFDLIGEPVRYPFSVTFDQPEKEFELKNLPVPDRFGTFAVILIKGDKRQFLCTLCRVPQPRDNGTLENTPIFGEGQIIGQNPADRARMYARMGIRGWRSELSWSESADGKYHWDNYDKLFAGAEAANAKIMVTLGGHPQWAWPFSPSQTPAAVGPNWNGNAYWGQCDWLCDPKMYPRYGKWITAFCERYWKNGKGALWGIENYNEPWEGGGISGWARDCLQYRAIQKLIATSAKKVDSRIKILAASSVMNTEDKLFSDGSKEFEAYLDIMTDHYVPPAMCYGPMVAATHNIESMETETWFVSTEYLLPQGVAQFMAAGQKRLAPWHPRVLFDGIPGTNDQYLIPSPVVAASAAFNYFVTGKDFEKIVFHDHLPWLFQFGKDTDNDALLVMFGQLMTIGGNSPKERLWAQVDGTPGGTITIDNADGLLSFYDLSGNPLYVGQAKVELPMSIFPTYIKSKKGPVAAAERINEARIAGKKPVEIIPRDFSTLLTSGKAQLVVDIHNCLNRAISGKLMVTTPDEITLAARQADVELAAGETRSVMLKVAKAQPNAGNSYPFTFNFTSDAGKAEYAEAMNVAVARKMTPKIDGNLDDWKNVPGINLVAGKDEVDSTELKRRPWLESKAKMPDGTFAEVKLAWDEKYIYVAAMVNDKTDEPWPIRMATRDEDSYFHTAADDKLPQFKRFLEKYPGRSMAEVPYVYAKSPERGIPFRRDRLQVAFDTSDGWHDFASTTDKVPYGYHAVPDTDYEYSLYLCGDGGSELWRQLAPGVPRIADFPRQPRGPITTGAVEKAKHVVKREGSTYIYEMAIPKSEIQQMNLTAGTKFGFVFKIGNSGGPNIEYGEDKAACKINGLTLHPYWERSPSDGVKWTLVN